LNDSADKRLEVGLEDENDRYHRQNLITWWDQERLADASVLVVGAGALGNELVKNLALIGVGHIVVIDMDTIESSNLARCVFFRAEDEGRFKAEVLAERAASLNPEVEVLPIVGDVRLALGIGYFDDVDLVIGGLDNREARMYVNQACWKTSTPWVDGAIEGLMGIVRVFMPPETACYECTMSERDHELVAARRSCTLLSRDEMLGGKVPTTATTASVIAAIEVQEAVKLLHTERLGDSVLAGAGYHFVGLTHDSYVVRYTKREDCLSHDTYEAERIEAVLAGATFAEVLKRARNDLGAEAIIELEQEVALAGSCESCAVHERIERPVDTLDAGHGLCPECGLAWRLQFAHSVDDDSPLLDRTPKEIGLPDNDYLVGRVGTERRFYRLGEPGSSLESLREALA
jgi:molybdopterin/thiamine biosynthesis adenylyltransferase